MADEELNSQDRMGSGNNRRSKLERVITERGLEDLGRELEDLWTGTGKEQVSLRNLADYFNQRILQAAMQAADQDPLTGETENLYKLLTSDEVTSGTQIQAERRLEETGIDIERLRNDFVSHQAVHTYLTKYRGVKPPVDDANPNIETSRNTIQKLRNRLQAVTETTIETLLNSNKLSLGEYHVYVDLRVMCTDCQTQYSITELFDSGKCDCD